MPFHRNALVLCKRLYLAPLLLPGMQLDCSHFFLWSRRIWCLLMVGRGDGSILQLPAALSKKVRARSLPHEQGLKSCCLPAALAFRKDHPSPFTNPTVKNKRWEIKKEDGSGGDADLLGTGWPVAPLAGGAHGTVGEPVFGCSDAMVALTGSLPLSLCSPSSCDPIKPDPISSPDFGELFMLATPRHGLLHSTGRLA